MPDTTVQFKGPMGDVVLSVDLNNILIELTRICNDSLSTAAFQMTTQGKGVIYRHPYIPVGTPTTNDVPIWNGTVYAPGAVDTAIAAGSITRAMLANGTALSVIGRSANSAGAVADIAAASNNTVLKRVSDSLSFASVVEADLGLTDVTTANASTAAHGLAPKNSNLVTPNVCLIGTYAGTNQTAAITRVGTTATYSLTAHGRSNGDIVQIANAGEAAYNILAVISNVTANTFDYTVAGSPATPSTGTSRIEFWFKGTRSFGSTLISTVTRAAAGNYTVNLLNTQADTYYGINFRGSSSSLPDGLVGNPYSITTSAFAMVFYRQNTSAGAAVEANGSIQLMLTGII